MSDGMPWRAERLPEQKKGHGGKGLFRLLLGAGIAGIAAYSSLQLVAGLAETTYRPPEPQAAAAAVVAHDMKGKEPSPQPVAEELLATPTHVMQQASPTPMPTVVPDEMTLLETDLVAPQEEMPALAADSLEGISIVYYGETAVIGLDAPIESRERLDEIERGFVRLAFPGFPEELFSPATEEMGRRIQDIRLASWGYEGNDHVRTMEFIVAEETLARLRDTYGVADPIAMLAAHADAINEIWDNSMPRIQRHAVMERIIIVNADVLSEDGGNWHVVNDPSVGWWANDTLNGAQGFIPYDIDSRWALAEGWADLYPYFGEFNNVRVDYGLLHELTHHLPVGDNYVYPPGSGRGFSLEQPVGKTAVFGWGDILFMPNDHMAGPGARNLTAPSSYNILEFWRLNPEHARESQWNPYPVQHVYGNFFFDRLTLRLEGLADAGIEGCTYMRQDMDGGPDDEPFPVVPSDEHAGIEFTGDACTVSLDRQHQADAWPGAYIGLERGGIVFPVYFPRVLMETLYWKEALTGGEVPDEHTFTMGFTPHFSEAIEQYTEKIRSGEEEMAGMWPHSLVMYMDVLQEGGLPESAIAHGAIDSLGNSYVIEYRLERE